MGVVSFGLGTDECPATFKPAGDPRSSVSEDDTGTTGARATGEGSAAAGGAGDGDSDSDTPVERSDEHADDSSESSAGLPPAAKSSLLWGVVGALCFLVLIQGYELLTDQRISFLVKFAVAVVVGVVAGGSTYAVRGRLPAENESA